jgi:elongation factor G
VVFRETITVPREAHAVFERELKEATLYGEARVRVAPRGRGEGLRVRASVPEAAALPPALRDAALGGLEEAAQTGLGGHPLDDLEATLLEVGYREGEQPEVGVKVAAGEAFRRAVAAASPIRLEPIMDLEALVAEEHLGPVIGDLRQRRAQILELGTRGAMKAVRARVPLRNMFGYSTDLRSLTKGRSSFTLEFHAYDNLETGAVR